MKNHSFLLLVFLVVEGVFGVDPDGVKSVSVMEGDSVTLHTNLTEIQADGELMWKTEENFIIAEIDKETNKNSVPGNDTGRLKGRLKIDDKTGSLTITNIKTTHSGVYNLQIRGKDSSPKKEFSVEVHGTFSNVGVKNIPAWEGESVILQTDIANIPVEDVIEWTFGPQDTVLVKTDRLKNKPIYNETLKDRLYLNTKSGDLQVKNIRTDVSGQYKLKIIKSTYTLQKMFDVTLSGGSSGTGVSGMCGASVLVWAVAVFVLQEV